MTDRRRTVLWAPVAQRDLADILLYLEQESPSAARRLLGRIEEAAASLQELATRGRRVPELAALELLEYRELVLPPYRLIYRAGREHVSVLAVLDSRRNLEDLLLRRLLRD